MTSNKFSLANALPAAVCAILLSTVCIAGAIAPAQAHQFAAPYKG